MGKGTFFWNFRPVKSGISVKLKFNASCFTLPLSLTVCDRRLCEGEDWVMEVEFDSKEQVGQSRVTGSWADDHFTELQVVGAEWVMREQDRRGRVTVKEGERRLHYQAGYVENIRVGHSVLRVIFITIVLQNI